MSIKPINPHYSMTNLASVYDEEALTALELAGRTAAKVNETVEAFNTLESQTNTHLTEQDDEIANRTAAQDKAIPEKVEAAVDDHIANGAFDAAINLYAGDLETRVDNLVGSVKVGSTTMDAEIIDARAGDTGKVYTNLRSSIQGQIGKAINETGLFSDVNRFNPNTVTVGYYIKPNGDLASNSAHVSSDFMRVNPNETIVFTYRRQRSEATFVYFYDEAKNILAGSHSYTKKVVVPEGAYFMRICHASSVNPESDFMVSTPYYGTKQLAYGERFNYDVDDAEPYRIAYGNRFNPTRYIENCYVSFEDGLTIPNETPNLYVASDLMPILPLETIKMCGSDMVRRPIRMIAGYDKNFNFVSGAENVETFTQSGDIKYIRVTILTENLNDTIICDNAQGVWCDYGQYIIKNENGENTRQLSSMIGGASFRMSDLTLNAGGYYNFADFPYYLKNNHSISFSGNFSSFSSITIGRGKYDSSYGTLWYEITPTAITVMGKRSSVETYETVNHGLTISGFIKVVITYTDNKPTITIITAGGTFTHAHNGAGRDCGQLFVAVGQNTTDITISATCADFTKPLWLVGDSYFGYTRDRVIGALRNLGFTNYLCLAMSGLNSAKALEDLNRAFAYGTPKYLVWYLGMNDGATSANYAPYLDQLKAICRERNITLILNRVPSVPTIAKEPISSVVVNSGLRYIDSYAAVGANSSGAWVAGALSSDGVHPTEQGAAILAAQMVVDVPEIMNLGKE